MKNKIFHICCFLLIVSLFTACQPTPAPPSEAEPVVQEPAEVPAAPAEEPAPPQSTVITESNAANLTMVLNERLGTGAMTIHWQNDSSAFWLQDMFEVYRHDAESAHKLAEFSMGEYAAIFDISPDGNTIAYALGEDGIHLYDVASETDTLVFPVDFPYRSAFYSPDGSMIAVPSMLDLKIVFFDILSGTEIGSSSGFSTAAPAYSAKFSPDGKTLLWFARGTVQSQDIASQQMGPILSHEDFVTYREMSSDGKVIATTAAGMVDDEYTPLITIWNAANGNRIAQIPLPTYYTGISISPDSTLIAAGSENGIFIYTSPYGEQIGHYVTSEAISDIAFSPDGTKLLAMSNLGLLYMYSFR